MLFFITFRVGWVFYKNGEIYIRMLLPSDQHLVTSINKLLLAGYYLTNLGYVVLNLAYWEYINSLQMMIEVVVLKASGIILMLALMHYFNLFWLLLFSRKQKGKSNQYNHTNL
jgi:hypothetical protein